MENKAISRSFRLLSQLMELQQENSFKIKTIANAAIKIDKLPYPIHTKSLAEISQIEGLGKSTAAKVWELLETGKLSDIERISAEIPEGIVEMLSLKGIGPKRSSPSGKIWA
jgi:DNA polymerase (family 10)